jgi:hypothetical protein
MPDHSTLASISLIIVMMSIIAVVVIKIVKHLVAGAVSIIIVMMNLVATVTTVRI